MPPVPVKSSGLPYEEPDRTFLDDISNELLMLMKQRPQHERESHAGNLAAEAASTQLSCLFGTMNCEWASASSDLVKKHADCDC